MATQPSRKAILSLYASTLRTAKSFSSYNFRNYFVSRTQDTFRGMQVEQDSTKLSQAYDKAVNELAVLRRSAVLNQLYGGLRLAVEEQSNVRTRGDT
ncbi:uncharacterized protein BJ212DRAFT_1459466 [Suillus subaureus]|uniref:Complex 1 LYR protein domain-containing protein n=1 Tax=Suillus subaureus TaxID=48587 RepID=A0A9P7EEQ5_9AGAM|nr:uncharacterized protein BJ212DRAFT_1459466 [Suillus subaureus]KAG1818995.1 hypothetical protein BJ212DRAFT_1459466 [Suillus subaureus]